MCTNPASRNAHPLYWTKVQHWKYFQLWKHASDNNPQILGEAHNNERSLVQKRRRPADTAERGGIRSVWQKRNKIAIEALFPLESASRETKTIKNLTSFFLGFLFIVFLVCWFSGMVSWYGEITPRPHQRNHLFPYLHRRRFVLSGSHFFGFPFVYLFSLSLLELNYNCSFDLFQQTITKEKSSSDSYDLVRTARMGAYGLLILGPVQHQWFGFMSRLFPKQDFITTFKKMAMGQTVYGPTIMVIFLPFNALLQGNASWIRMMQVV